MDQTVHTSPWDYTFSAPPMNQLHVLPEDWSAAADLLTPLLGGIDPAVSGAQALVVTNDADAAAGISGRVVARGVSDVRLLAATDARRATRLLSATPAHVVIGPPEVLMQTVRSSTLKLGSVQTVVLAWVDNLDAAATGALEAIMSEVPKDASRLVLAAAPTAAVDQLVDRYAWRARRLQPVEGEATPPVSVSYVTAAETGRLPMLRRILDASDPESAIVIAVTAEARANVSQLLRSLGYSGDSDAIRLAATRDEHAAMAVLFELPSTAEEFRTVVRGAGATRVVAIVAPRQLDTLRRFAGGSVTPFALPAAAERARSKAEQVRDELRVVLAAGQYSREVLALEPLLAEFDGSEVAAAALRLLEAERAKPRAAAPSEAAAMTRLYVNVGEMDNVRPADLVGAITNEAGISRSEVGRVEVRERHSTVEVASGVANAVVEKMTGVSIKGRRALVKIDEGPRERPGRPMRPKPDRPRRPR